MTVKDLKPRGLKAPLHLIPAKPLRAIAAAMHDGAEKYKPWNWTEATEDWRETYGSALRRHVDAFTDATESDYAGDSGIHHLAHAGACILILLWHLGVDYMRPDERLEHMSPEERAKREVEKLHPETRTQSVFNSTKYLHDPFEPRVREAGEVV